MENVTPVVSTPGELGPDELVSAYRQKPQLYWRDRYAERNALRFPSDQLMEMLGSIERQIAHPLISDATRNGLTMMAEGIRMVQQGYATEIDGD